MAIEQESYQELTRRAAHCPPHGRNHYAEYLLLVTACQKILSDMPGSVEMLDQVEIEEKLADGMQAIADVVKQLLPGGYREFRSYMTGEMPDW